MSSPVSGDLLSAASLLATVVSLLYSTWYSEIKDARNVEIPLSDRKPITEKVRTALWFRARPLLATAILLTAILTPTFIDVLHANWNAITHSGHWHYDPVQACFIGVFLVMILLDILTASATCRLTGVLKKVRTPVGTVSTKAASK